MQVFGNATLEFGGDTLTELLGDYVWLGDRYHIYRGSLSGPVFRK
jgi:hypothetical protein